MPPERYGSGTRLPITVIVVKRPSLLAQVLAVNALLIAATVLTATLAVHLDPDTVISRIP